MLFILCEEQSMKAFLEEFLPRFLPKEINFKIIAHEGKSDLQKSIPAKINALRNIPGAKFVILHDQDSADCRILKSELISLCPFYDKQIILIRVVCSELESWLLGDLVSVGQVFSQSRIGGLQAKRKYRVPDKISNASEEIKKLVPTYQKVSGARKLGKSIDSDRNVSESFRAFLTGMKQLMT